MELKPKYQYTYFIKPFEIKPKNYSEYISKILRDKNFRLKVWEKEADIDIYSYFLPDLRNNIFYGFDNDEIIENNISINNKLKILEKRTCIHFEYILDRETPGKIGMENGIFFSIPQIDLVCFNTGLCFILIKTYIDDVREFSEILNFNYKFREITANLSDLNEYEKINIQTDAFNSSEEFNKLIDNIVGENTKLFDDEKFYVYSYTCIDGENWNDKITFEDIKVEFWKYSNILQSNYNIDINYKRNIEPISDWEYARFGFNKSACVLLTSSLNSYNYTKLPMEFERQYLYTYLIALYQKLYLKKLTNEFKKRKNINEVRKYLNSFIKDFWIKETTKEEIGSSFYEKWQKIFEIDNIYLETMNAYDLGYKEQKKWKSELIAKIVVALVSACVILNIISLCVILSE